MTHLRCGSSGYPRAVRADCDAPEAASDHVYQEYPFGGAHSECYDILDILDKEIDFYSSAGYPESDVRYFDVDDLYAQQADDEYDYPREVDDSDDDYLSDPDLRAHNERGTSSFGTPPPSVAQFDLASFEEGEMTNAQYFDALELYASADVPVSSHSDEDDVDSDFETEDDFLAHSTVHPSLSSALEKGFRSQHDREGRASLRKSFTFERHLHYSGFDELEEKSLDILLVPERAW